MSRARRPVVILRPRERWALWDAFFADAAGILDGPCAAFHLRRVAKCLTRPSILRGAILGRPISARAAARLLANLGSA